MAKALDKATTAVHKGLVKAYREERRLAARAKKFALGSSV